MTDIYLYDAANRALYFKESSVCWVRQVGFVTEWEALALRSGVSQVLIDRRGRSGTVNTVGVDDAHINVEYFDQWHKSQQEKPPVYVYDGATSVLYQEKSDLSWVEAMVGVTKRDALSRGAHAQVIIDERFFHAGAVYAVGLTNFEDKLRDYDAWKGSQLRLKRQNIELARAATIKLPSQVLLGHCKECSAQIAASALKQGMCGYCAHSLAASRTAPLERSRHTGRIDAALLAERPKPSRDSNLPHPWEAWSTPGDES